MYAPLRIQKSRRTATRHSKLSDPQPSPFAGGFASMTSLRPSASRTRVMWLSTLILPPSRLTCTSCPYFFSSVSSIAGASCTVPRQLVVAPAERLGPGVAVDLLGRLVPVDDVATDLPHEDRLVGLLKQLRLVTQPLLVTLEGIDVDKDYHHAIDHVIHGAVRPQPEEVPLAVLVEDLEFLDRHGARGALRELPGGGHLLRIARSPPLALLRRPEAAAQRLRFSQAWLFRDGTSPATDARVAELLQSSRDSRPLAHLSGREFPALPGC